MPVTPAALSDEVAVHPGPVSGAEARLLSDLQPVGPSTDLLVLSHCSPLPIPLVSLQVSVGTRYAHRGTGGQVTGHMPDAPPDAAGATGGGWGRDTAASATLLVSDSGGRRCCVDVRLAQRGTDPPGSREATGRKYQTPTAALNPPPHSGMRVALRVMNQQHGCSLAGDGHETGSGQAGSADWIPS